MNKRTKLAVIIAALAAVVSAVVLVIVFWDKLLALCPCRKAAEELCCGPETEPAEAGPAYDAEELADFADLGEVKA